MWALALLAWVFLRSRIPPTLWLLIILLPIRCLVAREYTLSTLSTLLKLFLESLCWNTGFETTYPNPQFLFFLLLCVSLLLLLFSSLPRSSPRTPNPAQISMYHSGPNKSDNRKDPVIIIHRLLVIKMALACACCVMVTSHLIRHLIPLPWVNILKMHFAKAFCPFHFTHSLAPVLLFYGHEEIKLVKDLVVGRAVWCKPGQVVLIYEKFVAIFQCGWNNLMTIYLQKIMAQPLLLLEVIFVNDALGTAYHSSSSLPPSAVLLIFVDYGCRQEHIWISLNSKHSDKAPFE